MLEVLAVMSHGDFLGHEHRCHDSRGNDFYIGILRGQMLT